MNDRFKFRMYDTNVNKMYMPNDYGGVESIYECIKQQINWDLDVDYDIKFNHLEDGRFFMQCTGLKDKNGKLIYEGDVVNGSCGVYWGKMIVEYNVAGFVLNKNGKYLNFLEGDNYIEVIGNIYENKELLESEEE